MQRSRVADGRDSQETRLALLTQPRKRRHHLIEYLPDAERWPAPHFRDRVVQVEDVDPIETQPRQTAFERLRYGIGDAADVCG